MIEYLVEHGADVNKIDIKGETPLLITSSRVIKKYLIEHGADINKPDKYDEIQLFFRGLRKSLREIYSFFDYSLGHIHCYNNYDYYKYRWENDKREKEIEMYIKSIAHNEDLAVDINKTNRYEYRINIKKDKTNNYGRKKPYYHFRGKGKNK